MNRKRLTIEIMVFTVIAGFGLMAQEKSLLRLTTAVRSAVFPNIVGVITNFQNGFRPQWNLDQKWVRLYDSNGSLVRTNVVDLPGTESVSIWSVAVSKTGLIAVAATALSADGAEARTIILFDQPGAPRLVIRTNPFFPRRVTIAPDGFIWIAGTDPDTEYRRQPATPEQKEELRVLQKYTATGLLVGSYLKRSTFVGKISPWDGLLQASASGVGLYIPQKDGGGEWIELSLDGDLKGRWTIAVPGEGLRVLRVALTDSGSVYSAWRGAGGLPAGTYRLNKSTSTWDRVEDPPVQAGRGTPPGLPEFLGSDGDLLVFRTSVQPSHTLWFREPLR